jgi:uncharacterized membrane protein
MASDDEVQRQLAELAARVDLLAREVEALRSNSSAPQAPASRVAPASGINDHPSLPGSANPAAPPQRIAVRSRSAEQESPGTKLDAAKVGALEERIGSQVLNRVGIFAVLIAIAWFLKLAFDRDWIGPGVRIAVGLVIAIGLFVWSDRFRRHGFTAFSYTLEALGAGIAYLSLWATSNVFHLLPVSVVFFAMAGVTLTIALLAWRQGSEVLALYALAGGLATPALLSFGERHELILFSYLLILDAGALLLFALHPWKRMISTALAGTVLYGVLWSVRYYDSSAFSVTLASTIGFFFLFASAPFLLLRRIRSGVLPPSALVFLVAFPIVNAVVAFAALMSLYADPAHHAMWPWMVFALGVVCVLLAVSGPRAFTGLLSNVHLGLAVFFFTVAVPLEFEGCGVAVGWLVLALVLLLLAARRSSAAMRVFGTAVLTLAALDVLFLEWVAPVRQSTTVLLNAHFATYLAAVVAFAAVAYLGVHALRIPANLSSGSQSGGPPVLGSWRYLPVFSCVLFSLTLLLAVTVEVHHYWFCGAPLFQDFCGAAPGTRRAVYAGFTLSAWYMLYGAVLMAVGFWRHSAFFRWQALAILAFSIAKVFLQDISHLSQGYRVLSFLALGVLLLVVSFAYQKDWL